MSKTLILIRHAHRDNSRRELDNGLDDKGREQAKSLKKFFFARFSTEDLKGGLWLVSSPKIRCQETLLPIAKDLGRSVDVHPGLDEQGPKETGAEFSSRVQKFIKEWESSKVPTTVVCGHGDNLPLTVQHLLGWPQSFKKGAWLEVEMEGGSKALRWYIPSFKHFFK